MPKFAYKKNGAYFLLIYTSRGSLIYPWHIFAVVCLCDISLYGEGRRLRLPPLHLDVAKKKLSYNGRFIVVSQWFIYHDALILPLLLSPFFSSFMPKMCQWHHARKTAEEFHRVGQYCMNKRKDLRMPFFCFSFEIYVLKNIISKRR